MESFLNDKALGYSSRTEGLQPNLQFYMVTLHWQLLIKQKYLGVTFNCRLNWSSRGSSHSSQICRKMLKNYLMLISSHVKYLQNMIVKMLIESLVFSRYTYGLPVWGPAVSTDSMSRLQHMQNRAVHLSCSLPKYDHVSLSQQRTNLGWLAMHTFIQYQTILTMFGHFSW